jgi:3D (Asp-Asp-Asp) domain-containing protein
MIRTGLSGLLAALLLPGSAGGDTLEKQSVDDSSDKISLEVTATAFNSHPSQTDGDPNITAWGDRLEPGMKVIAVSRDLIALGLGHGTEVRIDGLPGRYVVRDKMAKRWKQKIDIYMGNDVDAARRWGRRTVTIRWNTD